MTDYSLDSKFVQKLDEDILTFIERGVDEFDEQAFNEIALREFELQFNTNLPYQQFCLEKGKTPGAIDNWAETPAVPSDAFKDLVLTSFPVKRATQILCTGGTTGGTRRGRIFRDNRAVQLINAANGLATKSFLFPDVERMKILLMAPSPQMVPNMGMAIGLEEARKRFGTPDSTFLITNRGLDVKTLIGSLCEAEDSGDPIALIGATAGFIYFFNACKREKVNFNLPPGSRICNGGGYQGRFGKCDREEYYERCETIFGVPRAYCVNTLGMCESSTNYFDNVLRDKFLGVESLERYKVALPWTRTIAVDTETFTRLPRGEIGLLCHYDLVNRPMVLAVLTDNLGYETEKGFEIIGRAKSGKGRILLVPSGEPVGRVGPPGKLARKISDFVLNRQMSSAIKAFAKNQKSAKPVGTNGNEKTIV